MPKNYPRQCLPAFSMVSAWSGMLLSLLCLFASGAVTASASAGSDPGQAPKAIITVDSANVLREALPDTFFGFNIRWTHFQKDLWDARNDRVKPEITDALKPFVGALYRYPGGLVANEYIWEEAMLPMDVRKQLDPLRKGPDKLPLFGLREFLDFVRAVDGTPLYTLNLVGKGKPSNIQEYPLARITESNRELARELRKLAPQYQPRYYQLGNELDRSKYEWPHSKYVERSLATIEAIQEVDPDARFIAFLREFDWRYRGGGGGVSRHQDLIRDVLTGLPMVNDYSIHIYYDGEVRAGGKFLHITDAVNRVRRTLAVASEVRKGAPPGVWITEHSRRIQVNRDNESVAKVLTTNLGGALSTADFLIAMAQVPEVKGTSVHALNGVARQLFDASVRHNDLRPRPVLSAMHVLNTGHDGAVLATRSSGPNLSGYPGGYDVRATAFANGPDGLAVWVVNRAARPVMADVAYQPFAGQAVDVLHYYLAGQDGVNADAVGDDVILELEPKPELSRFSDEGVAAVMLPPSSVSTFRFRKAPAD